MSFITEAYISGSLGQAVYIDRGRAMILDVARPNNPRLSTGNDIEFFFNSGLEILPVHERLTASDGLLQKLILETKQFDALDGVLIGMDCEQDESTRRKFIFRAERLINSDLIVARFVRGRLLVPIDRQKWDIAKARSLATMISAKAVNLLYEILSSEALDRLFGEADVVVQDFIGSGAKGAHAKEVVVKSGLLGEIAYAAQTDARASLTSLVFRQDDFPSLRSIDPNGVILTKLIGLYSDKTRPVKKQSKRKREKSVHDADVEVGGLSAAQERLITHREVSRERPKIRNIKQAKVYVGENRSEDHAEPIIAAIDRFIERHEQEKQGRIARRTTADSLDAIDREIAWIEKKLQEGNLDASESGLVRLIDYQSQRSRREHLVKSLTRIADSARKSKLFDFSAKVFSACALLGAEDVTARSAQAELLRDLCRLEDALVAFDETIRMFPGDVVPRSARAEVLRDLGKPEEALAALDETISLFPADVVPRNARAEVLRDLGKPEEALAALDEAISLFPHEVVPRVARAEVLRELGQPRGALAALNEIISLFPHELVPRNARAEVLRDLEKLEDALAALDETISLFPHGVVPRSARAEVLRELGKPEEALAALDEAISLFPREIVPRSARAEVLRELGETEKALAALDETITLFPYEAVSRSARAGVLRDLGKLDEALVALDEVITLFPHDVVPRAARAEVLRDLGAPENALAALDEAISLFPHAVVPRAARAEVLRDLGKPENALAALDEAIRLFPHDVVPRAARAEVLRELGKPEEALAALEETISLFPPDVVLFAARAETLRDLDRPADALAALDEAAKLFPHRRVIRTARAELLSQLGRHREVDQELGPILDGPRTRNDWIDFHVLAISRLRARKIDDAVKMLEKGRIESPFHDTRSYFDGALAVALLAKNDPTEAAKIVDRAEPLAATKEQRKTFYLLRVHATADIGMVDAAFDLLRHSATVIPFETFLQKRLAQELTRRVQLIKSDPSTSNQNRQINDVEILNLETRLVATMATKPGRSYRAAA